MQKWVTLGLVAVATLAVAGSTFADVPSSLTSTVACSCTADPLGGASTQTGAGKCTIGPAGAKFTEDLKCNCVIRNVLGAPLASSTVKAIATAVNGAGYEWDPSFGSPNEGTQTLTSDGSGNANFVFQHGGVSVAASPVLPDLNFVVTAQGPGAGGPVSLASCSPQLSVIGYDAVFTPSPGTVDLFDFAQFGIDLGAGNLRSDFTWSGVVDLFDFAAFGGNFNTVWP